MKKISLFDTTLRDGEQSPGASLTINEKITIAKQLEKLGVDVIESGFPISSNSEFESVKNVAKTISKSIVCGLARAVDEDIKCAWEAVKFAKKPRIHTFIATSDIHIEKKLEKTRDDVKKMSLRAVNYASSLCSDVEFSLEDATRTDVDFMCEIADIAINAGAKTINIPDTVGYAQPEEFSRRIKYLFKNTPSLDERITVSVHCHDDLGNAVANSLAGLKAGAKQVECTINGLGERAGNAPLEEIVMNIKTRKDVFSDYETNINCEEIFKTSRMVSQLTGINIQRNKAIVGKNAFSHESGIHQHGMLKSRETYEIISPKQVGWVGDGLVIGKHSGKAAIKKIIENLGYDFNPLEIKEVTLKVKELADKKKVVFREDISAIASEITAQLPENEQVVKLEDIKITTGNNIQPHAEIVLMIDGKKRKAKSIGIGPIDALANAIGKVIIPKPILKDYKLRAITSGTNALAHATITLVDQRKNEFIAKGIDQDVIIASAKGIIDGVNKILVFHKDRKGDENGW